MRAVAISAVAVLAALSLAGIAQARGASVRVRIIRLVDVSRRAHFSNGTSGVRVLTTFVRYPAGGRGPYPLIVFAHGFALLPQDYARLLDAWARAGFVVAAPIFPVENPNAPGGPSQADLLNEPKDISFVISRLTSSAGPLHGLVEPGKVGVAGQSDGGVAALSVAYDRRYLDKRVEAAMVMSGAAPPGFTGPARGAPPLLAVQGTNDPFNAPATTTAYFALMKPPKFLLWLLGASHKPPYTTDDTWSGAVERTTAAFFDHYLRGAPLHAVLVAGSQPGVARIEATY